MADDALVRVATPRETYALLGIEPVDPFVLWLAGAIAWLRQPQPPGARLPSHHGLGTHVPPFGPDFLWSASISPGKARSHLYFNHAQPTNLNRYVSQGELRIPHAHDPDLPEEVESRASRSGKRFTRDFFSQREVETMVLLVGSLCEVLSFRLTGGVEGDSMLHLELLVPAHPTLLDAVPSSHVWCPEHGTSLCERLGQQERCRTLRRARGLLVRPPRWGYRTRPTEETSP